MYETAQKLVYRNLTKVCKHGFAQAMLSWPLLPTFFIIFVIILIKLDPAVLVTVKCVHKPYPSTFFIHTLILPMIGTRPFLWAILAYMAVLLAP